jgi:hypothetical protein
VRVSDDGVGPRLGDSSRAIGQALGFADDLDAPLLQIDAEQQTHVHRVVDYYYPFRHFEEIADVEAAS